MDSWIVLFSRDGENPDFRRDFIAASEESAWRKAATWYRRKYPGVNIALAVQGVDPHPGVRVQRALEATR